MINFIKNHKIIIILVIILLIILLLIEFPRLNLGNVSPIPVPSGNTTQVSKFNLIPPVTNSAYKLPTYSQPPTDQNGNVSLDSPKIKTAIADVASLQTSLPIYIEGIKTSKGLVTTLNIYAEPTDPGYLIHVEIYGLDYTNTDLSKDNPNTTAFIETFQEVIKQLTTLGVDIHNVYFIFGQKPYIQSRADTWIRTFGLL